MKNVDFDQKNLVTFVQKIDFCLHPVLDPDLMTLEESNFLTDKWVDFFEHKNSLQAQVWIRAPALVVQVTAELSVLWRDTGKALSNFSAKSRPKPRATK